MINFASLFLEYSKELGEFISSVASLFLQELFVLIGATLKILFLELSRLDARYLSLLIVFDSDIVVQFFTIENRSLFHYNVQYVSIGIVS